jgi:glutamate-1-semialdehyde aminotransferase
LNLQGRYRESLSQLARAEQTIPLGSQTFSKSRTSLPVGASPLFAERGLAGRLWDIDGNEYVDLVAGLACVTLGYRDPDVDAAVTEQLTRGVVFSLPHRLEAEVAERIVAMVPAAEAVRFGKNGSDATAAAVRLARAFTGRDRVAVCGYHGWHDWYIGSTARDLGVPGAVRELTRGFAYNDLDSLDSVLADHPGEYAAVIMEPMNSTWPEPGFLDGVRDASHAAGALFVLDETITGFRFARGGAQEEFGVVPDLVTLGKGLGNGHPLSAVAGREDVMSLMTEIFFSGTFGGEALSLAAAGAVLDRIASTPTLKQLRSDGERLQSAVHVLLTETGADTFVSIGGHPTWHVLRWTDTSASTQWELRTLFLQEMMRRGVLLLSTHNLMAAHDNDDRDQVLGAYREVLPLLVAADREGSVRQRLECDVLEPLFRVR